MRRAALWLLLIMLASYSIAYSAVKDLNISWSDIEGLSINDGVVILSEGDRVDIYDDKTAQVLDTTKLKVDCVSSDVKIIPEDREDIYVEMKGYHISSPGYKVPVLNLTQDGETLNIEVQHSKNNNFLNRLSLDLTILVPQSYQGDLNVNTVSGDVSLQFGEYESLVVNTVSGDVSTSATSVVEGEFDTTSGDVKLRDYQGAVRVKSISGDTDIQFDQFTEGANVQSTSGSVIVSVPQGENFGIDVSTTSGEIQNTHEMIIDKLSDRKLIAHTNSHEHVINVSTISGDISIR